MIVAHELTRSFDGLVAVENLTLSVQQGELLALLGPNGSGKTTTVRMLMGLIAPTSGRAVVAGHPVSTQPADRSALRRACGLLTETPGFYDRLSGWDNLVFFARLYQVGETNLRATLQRHLHFMDLWDVRDRLVATYSKGMKQRLALIRAVFHEPSVVFFDEPTSGLDPEAAISVRELIRSLKGQGRTIVVCTHNLDEAARLADVVGILRRRLLRYDTIGALCNTPTQGEEIVIKLAKHDAAIPRLASLDGVTNLAVNNGVVEARVDDAKLRTPEIIRALVNQGADILEVGPRERSLEAVYLETLRGNE
jgi:ABC-2 type transport system ATP-binding protein